MGYAKNKNLALGIRHAADSASHSAIALGYLAAETRSQENDKAILEERLESLEKELTCAMRTKHEHQANLVALEKHLLSTKKGRRVFTAFKATRVKRQVFTVKIVNVEDVKI